MAVAASAARLNAIEYTMTESIASFAHSDGLIHACKASLLRSDIDLFSLPYIWFNLKADGCLRFSDYIFPASSRSFLAHISFDETVEKVVSLTW